MVPPVRPAPRVACPDATSHTRVQPTPPPLTPHVDTQPAPAGGGGDVSTLRALGCLSPVFGFIVLYYALSISLSIFNKEVVGEDTHGFPAPMLMVAIQFGFQYLILSGLAKVVPGMTHTPRTRRVLTGGGPLTESASGEASWVEWAQRIFFVGLLTGLDIGVSQVALETISLSTYTVIKAAGPLSVMLCSFGLGVEQFSWELLGVVAAICAGVAMVVEGEREEEQAGRTQAAGAPPDESAFPMMGIIFALAAMAVSGLRWTLTQTTLAHSDALAIGSHPLALLRVLLPAMTATVLALSVATEPLSQLGNDAFFSGPWHAVGFLAMLFGASVVALAMTGVEFALINRTSAVAVTIIGVCKEVLLIVCAVVLLGDAFGLLNMVGLALVVSGVALYKQSMQTSDRSADTNRRAEKEDDGEGRGRSFRRSNVSSSRGAKPSPIDIEPVPTASALGRIFNAKDAFTLDSELDSELDSLID